MRLREEGKKMKITEPFWPLMNKTSWVDFLGSFVFQFLQVALGCNGVFRFFSSSLDMAAFTQMSCDVFGV